MNRNLISKKSASKILIMATTVGVLAFFQNCVRGFDTVDLSSTGALSQTYSGDLKSVGITCQDPNVITPTEMRRLSRTELINTLKAVVGPALYAQVEPTVMSLPNDDIRKDPRNFPANYDGNQLEALDKISRQLGALVLSNETHRNSIAGTCSSAAVISDVCFTDFLKKFGKNAFRRPLTTQEISFFKEIYASAGTGKEGLSAVVSAITLAPEFLYHVEVGMPGVGSDQQFSLTDFEVASRISYLITDGPPDAELMAKAEDGSFRAANTLGLQVDRLLQSDGGKAKLHKFIRYWLMLDEFQGLPTASTYLDGINASGLADEMNRELYAFVDHIIYEKKGSYQDLLTSRRSFAKTAALASIYGHAVPTSEGQLMETDQNRMGLLLRSPILANGTNQTHPILRGVFMLRRVLCTDIPGPSAQDLATRTTDPFVPDPIHDSTAIMTAKQTSNPSCMNCHSQINPLGFALEGFDNLGRARSIDKIFDANGKFIAEHPVQINSSVYLGRSPNLQVNNATQLMLGVADSVMGPACFTRHLHRFYHVRREASTDGCSLMNSYGALQDAEGGLLAAIKASILNTYTDQKRIQ